MSKWRWVVFSGHNQGSLVLQCTLSLPAGWLCSREHGDLNEYWTIFSFAWTGTGVVHGVGAFGPCTSVPKYPWGGLAGCCYRSHASPGKPNGIRAGFLLVVYVCNKLSLQGESDSLRMTDPPLPGVLEPLESAFTTCIKHVPLGSRPVLGIYLSVTLSALYTDPGSTRNCT